MALVIGVCTLDGVGGRITSPLAVLFLLPMMASFWLRARKQDD
jgi:hypothetical protein